MMIKYVWCPRSTQYAEQNFGGVILKERTVLSSFYSEEEAKNAAEKIAQLGIEVTQVEELRPYYGIRSKQRAMPITGDIPSLASLTLNASAGTQDMNVLLAASVSASGMSDGQDQVTGRNYLLTVVSPEALVENVVQIIKDCNGYT